MASELKQDHLALASHSSVQKMLAKNGVNTPSPEEVVFSDFVVKINRKEKKQTRVLLITNKALYNLKPNDFGNCKRRIALDLIGAITLSTSSDEFAVHVPEEYDYRYSSAKKDSIAQVLQSLYASMPSNKNGRKLRVQTSADSALNDAIVTKQQAALMQREDILRRRRQLAAQAHDSDNEEQDANSADMTQMIENTEKVGLDDFELLRVLGRGSFGKVMQVKKKDTGKIYAMKILKKRAIIARNQVEHTKSERKILQSLQHPFLMTLRYAFQSPEKLYFVLDYYMGGELFFHLKNKRRFSEETARVYVAEIAMALGHLHSLGFIYRDLKPENILLDDQGHCCLTDFGLSKDIDPNNPESHTFCGTPEYLAPEIISASGHGKAVDWWSLGILLYELTVGIPPFYSQNVNEMYSKIQHGVLRFPPFLSEHCKDLIFQLLHRDPKKRLGSGNDLEDLKSHKFFQTLDWEKLYNKQIDPLYKPRVKNAADTSNFDNTFTSEPVVDSVSQDSAISKTLNQNSDAFTGFTFVDDNSALK